MFIHLSDKLNRKTPGPVGSAARTIERRLGPGVEATSWFQPRRFSSDDFKGGGPAGGGLAETPLHPLLGAVDFAFRNHYDVRLRPDDVWLAIAQGFALHVEKYAEALRSRFVSHEGQLVLAVRRNDFVKGSPDNDWPGVYAELSGLIAEHLGSAKQRLLVSDFSTTSPTDRAASEVVLLGAMKAYFKYEVYTLCDIPAIHLAGTRADWQSVRDRAAFLGEFHQDSAPLRWWTDALLPVLDRFVAAFDGDVDRAFWCSIYKLHGGSGGPSVTGWINALFPYFDGKNWKTGAREIRAMPEGVHGDGPHTDQFTSGISRVPFEWHYHGEVFPMEFLGGFVQAAWEVVDGRTVVFPVVGWAVRDPAGQPTIRKSRRGEEE